ncbi:hypothetical protein [Methanobrevibacter sp.]|uniref:hypothetical protein n=1 Tax=Methanobrevibacter sp. TaxID=66852 RepID=UPI002E790F03|nr:hypothetical protein [Methanobrevibacter sp.]MEE0024640.1 hypothetical protein [Methanobrevibacter sp.]
MGNNVWNSTKIGSVTLGLIESYMNNETLELFASNSYIFIKHATDNNTLLFLDLKQVLYVIVLVIMVFLEQCHVIMIILLKMHGSMEIIFLIK